MIWVAFILLLACSAVISGSETALFALSRRELADFSRQASPFGRAPHRVMLHPRRVLMTALIANTLVNVSIFSLSFVSLEHANAKPALAAGVGLLVLLSVVVVGEMIPKAMALANARLVAPWAAALLSTLQVLFGPVQWVLAAALVEPITRLIAPVRRQPDHVTVDELKLLVEHSANEGHIHSTENEMLQSIVAMEEVSVREVMTPRVDIEAVCLEDPPAEIAVAVRRSQKRVLPVYGHDLDDVRGVMYVREVLLHPSAAVEAVLRPVEYVPEQASLAQVLRHFVDTRGHAAVVVDEYGGTSGLVTNEDLVTWVVGQGAPTTAPGDETISEQLDENTYRLSGDLSVRVWAERFGVREIDRHVDTIGGWVLSRLGRLPRAGDSVRFRNLTLTVEDVQHRRIGWVIVRRDGKPADTEHVNA